MAVTIKVKKHFANLFFKAQTIIILKFSEKNVLMKLVHPGRYLHKNHKAAESGEKHFRAYKIFRAGLYRSVRGTAVLIQAQIGSN